MFAMLLERDLPEPAPVPSGERLWRAWENLLAYCGSRAQALTVLALSVVAVGGAGLVALLGLETAVSPRAIGPSLIGLLTLLRGIFGFTGPPLWKIAHILENASLVLVSLLILLLFWYAVLKHHLPWRWEQWLHRRPNVIVNLTSFLLVLTLLLPGLSLRDDGATTSVPPPPLRTGAGMTRLGEFVSQIHSTGTYAFDFPIGYAIQPVPGLVGGEITIFAPFSKHLDWKYRTVTTDPQRIDSHSIAFSHVPWPYGANGTSTITLHDSVSNRGHLTDGIPIGAVPPRPFERQIPDIEPVVTSRLNVLLLITYSMGVSVLYALMWNVVRRAGRLRLIYGPRPGGLRRPP